MDGVGWASEAMGAELSPSYVQGYGSGSMRAGAPRGAAERTGRLDAQAQRQAEGWSTSEALFEGWMDGRGGPEAA